MYNKDNDEYTVSEAINLGKECWHSRGGGCSKKDCHGLPDPGASRLYVDSSPDWCLGFKQDEKIDCWYYKNNNDHVTVTWPFYNLWWVALLGGGGVLGILAGILLLPKRRKNKADTYIPDPLPPAPPAPSTSSSAAAATAVAIAGGSTPPTAPAPPPHPPQPIHAPITINMPVHITGPTANASNMAPQHHGDYAASTQYSHRNNQRTIQQERHVPVAMVPLSMIQPNGTGVMTTPGFGSIATGGMQPNAPQTIAYGGSGAGVMYEELPPVPPPVVEARPYYAATSDAYGTSSMAPVMRPQPPGIQTPPPPPPPMPSYSYQPPAMQRPPDQPGSGSRYM
jgi:hypothetical protein